MRNIAPSIGRRLAAIEEKLTPPNFRTVVVPSRRLPRCALTAG
jgi:hypothetical protein